MKKLTPEERAAKKASVAAPSMNKTVVEIKDKPAKKKKEETPAAAEEVAVEDASELVVEEVLAEKVEEAPEA